MSNVNEKEIRNKRTNNKMGCDIMIDRISDSVEDILKSAICAQAKRIEDSAEDLASVAANRYKNWFREASAIVDETEEKEDLMDAYRNVLLECNGMVADIERNIIVMVDEIIRYIDRAKDVLSDADTERPAE